MGNSLSESMIDFYFPKTDNNQLIIDNEVYDNEITNNEVFEPIDNYLRICGSCFLDNNKTNLKTSSKISHNECGLCEENIPSSRFICDKCAIDNNKCHLCGDKLHKAKKYYEIILFSFNNKLNFMEECFHSYHKIRIMDLLLLISRNPETNIAKVIDIFEQSSHN